MLLDSVDQWLGYIGRFHPVVVHLPIGILFMAFILELPLYKKKLGQQAQQIIQLILAAGFISALVSCVLGWLLRSEGSYDKTTLNLHQWMGITVAFIAGICWWFKKKQVSQSNQLYYSGSLILLCITLFITGHYGGSLTHGEGYLTAAMPQPFADWMGLKNSGDTTHYERKKIDDINEALVYSDLVQGILHQKCYNCHSAKKIKGGLRVDEEQLLFKGGKHGVVIKPGSPDESELLIRILLPETDDKKMPPKKEQSLTQEEIAVLHWWIENGADTQKKLKDFSTTASILPMLGSFATTSDTNQTAITPLSVVFDKQIAAADQKDITSLTDLGILVFPIAKNSSLLEVSCVNYPAFDDSKITLLLKIADNIVSLKMDGTHVTNALFDTIGVFKNLVKLNLAQTTLTDEGITNLQSLKTLEYLNITGTQISDVGLESLAGVGSLQHVYCWNSRITIKGIEKFNKERKATIAEAGN